MEFTTYAAAIEFLQRRINYERQPVAAYGEQHFKLARMRELLDRLGAPDRQFSVVHVAGTKGKGSTAAMLASVFTAAGYGCGVYSSPHLERVEERLAVDGEPIESDELRRLLSQVATACQTMDQATARLSPDETGPTYFEVLTATAMLYFAARRVRVAVIEVGLGGRLDSTNVCEPVVSVITSISFDHMKQLGTTLAAIAREKAGIAKPGVPLVSGARDPEARQVIAEHCQVVGAPLVAIGSEFDFTYRAAAPPNLAPAEFDFHDRRSRVDWSRLRLALHGHHQTANAAVACAVLAELARQGWCLPEAAIRRGLAGARLPARVEHLAGSPEIVIDAAHNRASAAALAATVDEMFPGRRRWLVFGTTLEKDLTGMLEVLLPAFPRILFTRYASNPRGVVAEELYALAQQLAGNCPDTEFAVSPDPSSAWQQVLSWAAPADVICVTGSFFLAAEIRPWINASRARCTAAIGDQDPTRAVTSVANSPPAVPHA